MLADFVNSQNSFKVMREVKINCHQLLTCLHLGGFLNSLLFEGGEQQRLFLQ